MLDHFFLRYVSYFGLNHLCRYEVYFFILIKFWSCAFYSFGEKQCNQSLDEILSLNTNNHEKCRYLISMSIFDIQYTVYPRKNVNILSQKNVTIFITINYSRYLYGEKNYSP
jgi:hypothetical protein